jgi:hypothetical protein
VAWTVRVERDEGGIQPRVTKRRRPEETKRDERFKRLEGWTVHASEGVQVSMQSPDDVPGSCAERELRQRK